MRERYSCTICCNVYFLESWRPREVSRVGILNDFAAGNSFILFLEN